jgi:hypothetical protein
MSSIITPGTTGYSVIFSLVDDSGLAVTGKVAAALPSIYWVPNNRTQATQITLADLSLITSAWSSGGVKEYAGFGGRYRLDVPDAAFASAATISVFGEASGMHVICESVVVANVPADIEAIGGSTTRLTAFARAADAIAIGTVGTGSTTSVIVTSSLTPAAATINQFAGRIFTLITGTTTTNLKCQGSPILSMLADGTLTLTSQLSDAPVSGDLFCIT